MTCVWISLPSNGPQTTTPNTITNNHKNLISDVFFPFSMEKQGTIAKKQKDKIVGPYQLIVV